MIEIMGIILLLLLLQTKHLILDFVYQPPYQLMNKGTYGHLGGLVHTGQHVLGTLLVLLLYYCIVSISIWQIFIILALEFLVHYHMDWFKMWWCKRQGYNAMNTNKFWIWLGIDQYIHQLNYVLILLIVCL